MENLIYATITGLILMMISVGIYSIYAWIDNKMYSKNLKKWFKNHKENRKDTYIMTSGIEKDCV